MWTRADIPDQSGRTAVATGGNTGIGFHIAAALAKRGAHVVLAVRNTGKGEQALARVTETVPQASVSVQRLDLASVASVRTGCKPIALTAHNH